MTYVAEVLADSPYQYLRILEPSGATLTDASGNARAGALIASPSRIDGPIAGGGRAVELNGSTQVINTQQDIGANGATLSVEFWIRTTDTRAARYLFGAVGATTRLQMEQDTVPSAVQVRTPGGSGTTSGHNFNLTTRNIWDGEWHHVVVVVNRGASIGARIFVDGALHATVAPNSFSTQGAWGVPMYVGGRNDGGVDAPVTCAIAEPTLYTTALSEARVAAHYAARNVVPGVTLTVNVEGEGQVELDPDEEVYDPDDEVELTAIPDEGWEFSHWSGDLSGSVTPEQIVLDENKTVTAWFVEIPPVPEPEVDVTITGPGTFAGTFSLVEGADAYRVDVEVRAGVENV